VRQRNDNFTDIAVGMDGAGSVCSADVAKFVLQQPGCSTRSCIHRYCHSCCIFNAASL